MSRLTTKNNQYDGYIVVDDNTTVAEVVQKIGEYEDLEEETRLTVEEMAMILRDIKNIFNAKLYPNQLRIKDMPMTNWDLILTQPKFHCNNLPSERIDYKPTTIDCAINNADYEIYSKWLKEDKTE